MCQINHDLTSITLRASLARVRVSIVIISYTLVPHKYHQQLPSTHPFSAAYQPEPFKHPLRCPEHMYTFVINVPLERMYTNAHCSACSPAAAARLIPDVFELFVALCKIFVLFFEKFELCDNLCLTLNDDRIIGS